MPVTGWDPLGLSSAGLPVPHQGTTCAWTSMAQVGASDLGHWQAFGFRSAVGSAGTRRAWNSRSPGACETCSGAVDLSSGLLWPPVRYLAARQFPNTPAPRG